MVPAWAPAPPHPSRGDPGVFTWYNLDGSLWGHGFREDGRRWLSFPGLARYSIGARGGEAIAVPDEGVDLEAVVDGYRRFVLPLALHANGLEVLHASAVVMEDGVIGLCAHAKTGKSTAAFALSLRGHELWADDALAFRIADGIPEAIAQPFRLRLRRTAGEFFDARVPPEAFDPMLNGSLDEHRRPLPLRGLVLLERRGELDVQRMTPADALAPIIEQAYWYDVDEPGRKRLMMERYTALVSEIPVWRATFPPGFEMLDRLLDTIETAVVTDRGAGS